MKQSYSRESSVGMSQVFSVGQVQWSISHLIFVGMYGVSKKIVDNNIQKVRRIEWI